jgi:hypothetical protein
MICTSPGRNDMSRARPGRSVTSGTLSRTGQGSMLASLHPLARLILFMTRSFGILCRSPSHRTRCHRAPARPLQSALPAYGSLRQLRTYRSLALYRGTGESTLPSFSKLTRHDPHGVCTGRFRDKTTGLYGVAGSTCSSCPGKLISPVLLAKAPLPLRRSSDRDELPGARPQTLRHVRVKYCDQLKLVGIRDRVSDAAGVPTDTNHLRA